MTIDPIALVRAGEVLAGGSSDGDGGGFGLLFLLAGPLFYGYVYLRYRNTDKRHEHEKKTEATLHDVRGDDRQVRSLRGVSHSRMKGANNREVRGSLNQGWSGFNPFR